MSLDTLTVPITGSVAGLQTAFAQAGKMAGTFASGMQAKMAQVRGGINAVGGAAMRIVSPLAAAATAFASVKGVLDSLNRSDSLGKIANHLGVTTESLQKLHYAATMNASSVGAMDAALSNMARVLGETGEEASSAHKSLQRLGLSVEDLRGQTADQAFGTIADALNRVEDAGERAALSQALFGRGARDLGSVIKLGSAGMAELGKEAERTGKIMSAMDFGMLQVARGSLDKLSATFQSLADRLAIAIAPAIAWVSDALQDWIGNTKEFDATFARLTKAFAVGVGVMRVAWQGLQLLWEMGKVTVGAISVAFWTTANGIVKATKFIGETFSRTWDWIAATFAVNKDIIGVGWQWIKQKAIVAFSAIGEEFGKVIRSMGEAAASSRIKGLADIGRSAQEAGGEMIVGAVRLRQGAEEGLRAAKGSLDASLAALTDARAKLSAPIETTGGMEHLVDHARAFRDEAVASVREISEEIASQAGGNALTQTLDDYAAKVEEVNRRAVDAAKTAADQRALIGRNLADDEAAQLAAQEDRYQKYLTSITDRSVAAKENLLFQEMAVEERKQAMLDEARTNYEQRNLQERMAWAEMWVSGMEGKLQVLGGILSGFASLMQSKNRSMFEIGKAAAMAETVVNTFLSAQLAYTRALEIPGIGLALAPVAAASAIAGGLMRLQQISATQFGQKTAGGAGAGGMGGVSAAANAREGAAASSQSNVNVTMYGSTFSGEQVRGLIAAINDQVGDNMTLKAQVA